MKKYERRPAEGRVVLRGNADSGRQTARSWLPAPKLAYNPKYHRSVPHVEFVADTCESKSSYNTRWPYWTTRDPLFYADEFYVDRVTIIPSEEKHRLAHFQR